MNLLPSFVLPGFWTIWLLSHTTSLRSSHHAKFSTYVVLGLFFFLFFHLYRKGHLLPHNLLGRESPFSDFLWEFPILDFSHFNFGYYSITVITVSTVIWLTLSTSDLPTLQRGFFVLVVTHCFPCDSRRLLVSYCLLSCAIHDVCTCRVEYGLPYILYFSFVYFQPDISLTRLYTLTPLSRGSFNGVISQLCLSRRTLFCPNQPWIHPGPILRIVTKAFLVRT